MTRRGRSRSIARPMQRRIIYRRMGILAAAMAVPAMAAPPGGDARDHVQVRFALADVPQVMARQEPARLVQTESSALPAALEPASRLMPQPASGPAAPSLTVTGSLTDITRAEQCMTMAIYYEAASESVDGQRAVAQVVMNRVSHPAYPNSVCGVVFQGSERATGCQFSFTCDGSLSRQPGQAAWLRAGRVARAALGGFVYEPVGLATHYHTDEVSPYWAASLQQVSHIGAHLFYRWRGASGRPSAFTASYRGGEPLPVRNFASATYVPQRELIPAAPAATPPASEALAASTTSAISAISAPPAPVRAASAVQENLPMPGSVRSEYQQSGQWLKQP
ncbi:cell wall hydrolase [Alteraurantiacibacter aestuarii]|nr:cell wall hydrolase [Alteraurantiacibacter aestuarii]